MCFENIIGHERPIGMIRAMLGAGRLPHALLISGPAGVGKRTMALALAKAANCEGSDPAIGCGLCPSCEKIDRGTHPDVSETAPEGKANIIKVETIRELRNKINFRPYEGKVKVFIVLQADRMMEAAANALLKTLEEPPPQSLLILTSPEESDLLPTIISRCLRLSLAPLTRERVEGWLGENRGLTGPRARLAASFSGGCLGRAISIDPDELWSRRQDLIGRLEEISSGRLEQVTAWAADLSSSQDDWPEFFNMFRFYFRDLMILAGGGSEQRLVNSDLAGELETKAFGRRPDDYIRALEELDRAEDALNRFVRPDLVFENLMLSLAEL